MIKEWLNEPDDIAFEYKGFQCYLKRNRVYAWCGYVEIPEGNKYYRKNGDVETDDYEDIDVHGGITFAEATTSDDPYQKIIVIGFDCCHLEDFAPIEDYMNRKMLDLPVELQEKMTQLLHHPLLKKYAPEKTYRNIEFAKNECMKMVDQVIDKKINISEKCIHKKPIILKRKHGMKFFCCFPHSIEYINNMAAKKTKKISKSEL